MKIAILSRKGSLYSTSRLKQAAEEAGHEAMVVDYLRCYMNIATHRPSVVYGGKPLTVDAIIPRIGASNTFYGTAVVRQFEMMGVYPLNESQAISRSRDKLRCLQLLSRRGIGLPVTSFAHSTKDVEGVIELVGGAPLVVKILEGTQGIGVVLCENEKAAESVIEAFRGVDANILVQEFIKEAGGADLRAFVVGDRVVAAMRRQGAPGEFRSNLAPRRQRREGEADAGGTQHRRALREGHGPPRLRRRHAALEPRPGRDGGELLARPGGHREVHRHRRRRQDHQVHRSQGVAWQDR